MAKTPQKTNVPSEPPTTGHEWDGIREYDNPMPRWWLWTFYLTIIWGLAYTIAYPAWPLIKAATPGLIGYSTRAEVADKIREFEERNAAINARLEAVALTDIAGDAELLDYAEKAGEAVFNTWCVQCHGRGAAGSSQPGWAPGYPNLQDDDWLWGGDIEAIHYTIAHGIRNEDDPDARYSEMPAFGEILSDEEIDQVVAHVRAISRQEHDTALASAGAEVYLNNCAACHGDAGEGNRGIGAPNLADAIWLYGGSEEAIRYSVVNARYGVMPNWNTRLSEAEIRAVSTYVHTRGGGETLQ